MILAVVAVVAAMALGGDDGDPEEEAKAYDTEVISAFRPLVDVLTQVLPLRQGWRDGSKPVSELQSALDGAEDRFAETVKQVEKIPAYEEVPQAGGLYLASARLYRQFLEAEQTLVRLPAGPPADQLEVADRRLRTLADRVYDAARALVHGDDSEPESPDVTVTRSPEVPDWVAEGMAAGPPLDIEPPPAAEIPPAREGERATQGERDWIRAISGADIVPATKVASALSDGDPEALRDIAGRLEDTAAELGDVADPAGGRQRAVVVRLGLLVHAEAARMGQLATLVEDPALADDLRSIARQLLVIGDGVWDDALPDRDSGLTDG